VNGVKNGGSAQRTLKSRWHRISIRLALDVAEGSDVIWIEFIDQFVWGEYANKFRRIDANAHSSSIIVMGKLTYAKQIGLSQGLGHDACSTSDRLLNQPPVEVAFGDLSAHPAVSKFVTL